MSLRRFLYITPYFPPMSRVGAVRPLKFARHLPDFGWSPVVLCDLGRKDALNGGLCERLPESTTIVWDYGRRAAANKRAWDRGTLRARDVARSSWLTRLTRRIPPSWRLDPELFPLGEHSLDLPHALAAARRVLDEHPCEAIMVNADPWAALLVGARLARETGLPLIQDLRDPWALCSLRRPRRLPPQRALVDRLERAAFERAAAIVLNTHTARADYVARYSDLPAERFHAIRNHGDRELIRGGRHGGFDTFTMLMLGSFRDHVDGEVLLRALARLRARGLTARELKLVISGDCPPSVLERARRLGTDQMVVVHPFVPYLEIGSFMHDADLLVALSPDTPQRMPAKVFDYATSDRPMLVITDAPELVELMRGVPGTRVCGRTDARAVADAVHAELQAGRQRHVEREGTGLDSASASRQLAAILDRITGTATQPARARAAK